MTEKEKENFYIAMCRCCLLAATMKNCSVCIFNVNLFEQATPNNAFPVLIPVQIPILKMTE